jgi:kumamolisin
LAPGAREIGKVDGATKLSVTVYVRPNPKGKPLPAIEDLAMVPPAQRHLPSPAEIAASRNASAADLKSVADFAQHAGLKVVESSPEKRSVRLEGTADAMSKAFGVELRKFAHRTGDYRGRVGPVHIPVELAGVVQAVLGLDNRRMGQSYRRTTAHSLSANVGVHGVTPPQLAKLYNFPAGTDGSGECIGVLAFNGAIADTGATAPGGYKPQGLQAYFTQQLGIPMPNIIDVVVHGPGNVPGDGSDPNDSTPEILLDLETVGGIAPGARIAVYFTEFTEQGWVDALHAAVHDGQNAPSVISISYGNAETSSNANDPNQRGSLWTNAAIEQAHMAFQDAALKNITVTCASGDDGSSDGVDDGLAHVDFPASSPYVLACGGTRLQVSRGSLAGESVWNNGQGHGATGGGISDLFALPSWQQQVNVPPSVNPGHRIGRGVPDVASDADPSTGVLVSDVDGNVDPTAPTGGTSAAAPLWAALIARTNQTLGARVGFANPILYARCASGVLHDVTSGNNGSYRAAPGWDACTGLGTPDGQQLVVALGTSSPALQRVDRDQRVGVIEDRIAALESAVRGLSPAAFTTPTTSTDGRRQLRD